MFKSSFGHTASREHSSLILMIFCIYIFSRMASYKYQKNTQETALEKSMIRGLVCDFHAIYLLSMKYHIRKHDNCLEIRSKLINYF